MTPRVVAPVVFGAIVSIVPSIAFAGGFEIGSNTALSNARGGTGVASRTDASATTISPGRLAFTDGFQVVLSSNLVDKHISFQRDPLPRATDVVEYDEVTNAKRPFPVPYFALSYDFGLDNFAVGLSASGPHAYGKRCFSEYVDGDCVVDPANGARMMLVDTDILEVFFLATASYALEFSAGKLGFGLSGGPAYQNANLGIVVDQASLSVGPPYTENPDSQATFRASNLVDWKPIFIGGVAWEGNDGFRFGVTYQTGVSWTGEGTYDLELSDVVSEFAEIARDANGDPMNGVTFSTKQAHRLSVGVGHAIGEHPGVEGAPKFDLELNVIWEDWSRLEVFEVVPEGSLVVLETENLPLHPVVIEKGWLDTFALRLGGSYGAASWLTLHAGGFLETAAQPVSYTNVDFVSWERYSASTGFTLHIGDVLDVTASYAFVGSPSREVTDGNVYSPIPLSRCTYPDYDQPQCSQPGTPPGNAQNNGAWKTHTHIAGLSVGARF